MACNTITDYVIREQGRFVPEIYNRRFPRSPWMTLIPRGTWPAGRGDSLNILTYERMAPVTNPTWTTMATVSVAEGGLCLPVADKIKVGNTVRSMSLSRYVLEGPDFCAEDSRNAFELSTQLNDIYEILSDYAMKVWEMKHRSDYFTYCRHKIAITGTTLDDAWTTALDIPTAYPNDAAGAMSILTLGALDRMKAKLIRDGAGESVLGKENNLPILTVICSYETFDNILTLNTERRQDIRWGEPNKLLAPFGVAGSYKGYYFLCDPYPRRFTNVGGVFTEVLPFTIVTTWTNQGKGIKVEVNSAWEAADFEESAIFDPTVYTELVPEAVGAPAAMFKWTPQNYTGQWKIQNILDRTCNPDGTILYHRGIFGSAAQPVHPERGCCFVHRRCDPALNAVTSCPTT